MGTRQQTDPVLITDQTQDGLTEMLRWLEAAPSGLLFAAENGGTLPVIHLKCETFDLAAGEARFSILFAPLQKE